MRFTSWGVVRILLQQAKACTMLASTGWGLPTSDSTSTSTSPGIWSPSAPIELLLQHGEPPSTLDGGSILAIPISGYLILPNLPPFPTLATRSADLRENNCLPAHQILTPCPPSSFECFTNLAATVQERALTIQPCCSDWAHSARPHALACGALQKWLVWANDRGMQIRCWRRVLTPELLMGGWSHQPLLAQFISLLKPQQFHGCDGACIMSLGRIPTERKQWHVGKRRKRLQWGGSWMGLPTVLARLPGSWEAA